MQSFVLWFSRVSKSDAGSEDYLKTLDVEDSFKSREEAGKLVVGRQYATEEGNSPLCPVFYS